LLLCLAQSAWAADAQLVALQSAGVGDTPQRIVSLDELGTELLVSLGIEPVGVANLASYRRYIGIGNDLLERSVPLGSAQQPNLEAIARLKPDLIVGVAYLHLPLFERLDGLAPTLIYQVTLASAGYDGVAIGEAMLEHLGRLTGRQAQAAAVIREGRQALDAARQSVREQDLQGAGAAGQFHRPQPADADRQPVEPPGGALALDATFCTQPAPAHRHAQLRQRGGAARAVHRWAGAGAILR
jgi:ABC-type enterochelin transport system substrate-binding protein